MCVCAMLLFLGYWNKNLKTKLNRTKANAFQKRIEKINTF